MCNDKKLVVVILLTTVLIFITVITANKLREQSELAAAAENTAATEHTRTSDPAAKNKYKNSGVISENGSDILHIHDYVIDSSYGVSSHNILENDGIVSIEYLGSCGWDLIPQKSGHCGIAIDEYWVDYLGTDIYDITVDEDLKISYTVRDAWKYPLYNHSVEHMTVQNGDNITVFSSTDESNLLKELNALYGGSEYHTTAPDLSSYVKITCACAYAYDKYSYDLYVSRDRIYYFNENEEIWEEFTPDDFCSLDRINELLDLKD